MRVLIFGDSITYGAWDLEGGYVERLKKYAHEVTISSNGEEKLQILNLGIGGDTSTKLFHRLKNEIDSRYSKSWPFVFVFMIGTNDERVIEGKSEVSIEEFSDNIEKIITVAKSYTNNILFLGIPPLSEDIVVFKDQEYANARILQYDYELRKIAEAYNVKYVSTHDLFTNNSDYLHCYDGLHPNNSGHAILSNAVKNYLDQLTDI